VKATPRSSLKEKWPDSARKPVIPTCDPNTILDFRFEITSKRKLSRPLKMLIFSPTILALSLHMGLAYAYFYLLFTTFTSVFEETYNFSPNVVGLSYLGVGVGFLIGQMIYAQLGDLILKMVAAKRAGELKPQYRSPLSCIGAVCIPVGFFWYGWSAQAKVFCIVPII
jgi:hypothetical protein